jgi:peptidoglycan/LPS O-acetylase OafA/YrhL
MSSHRKFYLHRFRKLYQTYWLIWLLFVPLGVFVFHRGFADVYGDNMYLKLGLDFLGIIDCFNVNGYNLTWWFMSCIILLYLLFPLLYRLLDNNWALAVCLVMALNLVPSYMIVGPIRYYSVTFLLGMACVRYPIALSHQTKKLWLMLLLFCVLSVLRAFTEHHLLIDGGLTLLIVQFYQRFTLPRWLNRLLEFLGHHSMNIFLFHTFIFYYYFRDFVYYFKNPLVIFLLFLVVCIIISLEIERIKLVLKRIGLFI